MQTLNTTNLSDSLVNSILNTIKSKGYKVTYHYKHRRLKSIYFFDIQVFNRLSAYLKSNTK